MQGYLLVKPKGYQAKATGMQEGQAYTKADYEKQVKTNVDTQAVIDSVVAFITSHNYKGFPGSRGAGGRCNRSAWFC